MPEVIVFPDIEDLLVDYLTAEYTARSIEASAHTAIPDPRPDFFTTVPRVGGPRRSLVVDNPTIAMDSWAVTSLAAHDLAQLNRGLINALAGQVLGGHQIYRVDEFAGPANMPDPESKQARYTQTLSIWIRGHAI